MKRRDSRMRVIGAGLFLALVASVLVVPTASAAGTVDVLVVFSDRSDPPDATFLSGIAGSPGVNSVTTFNAYFATPTLAQLMTYEVVAVYTNYSPANSVALGDNLADYVDAEGIVVVMPYVNTDGWGIDGRFRSGGYYPLEYGEYLGGSVGLGASDTAHPLMQGVTALTSRNRIGGAMTTGSTLIASWSDSRPAVVLKGNVVGLNGYPKAGFGASGHYGRIIANAANINTPAPSGRGTIYHPLSVDKSGPGEGVVSGGQIDCGTNCDAMLAESTLVTLTASPDDSSIFMGWSGACEGTEPTCTVHMNGARNVVAEFGRRAHSVIVTNAGEGDGTVTGTGIACGDDCAEDVEPGEQITLTATPAAGSDFAGWSGACTGMGSCLLTVDAAKDVTATFVPEPPRDKVLGSRIRASYNDGVFSGDVTADAAEAAAVDCSGNRSVLVKKVRPGPDRTVARTQTDGTGEWSTEKATYRDGGYYAKLRRKVIDNGDGSKTTCRPARSGGIEIG